MRPAFKNRNPALAGILCLLASLPLYLCGQKQEEAYFEVTERVVTGVLHFEKDTVHFRRYIVRAQKRENTILYTRKLTWQNIAALSPDFTDRAIFENIAAEEDRGLRDSLLTVTFQTEGSNLRAFTDPAVCFTSSIPEGDTPVADCWYEYNSLFFSVFTPQFSTLVYNSAQAVATETIPAIPLETGRDYRILRLSRDSGVAPDSFSTKAEFDRQGTQFDMTATGLKDENGFFAGDFVLEARYFSGHGGIAYAFDRLVSVRKITDGAAIQKAGVLLQRQKKR